MLKVMAYVLIALLAAAAGAVLYLSQGPAQPPQVVMASAGSVKRSVRGQGRIEGLGDTVLSFGQAGRLDTVDVREGQEVVLNDTIATLNPADIKKRIEQAKEAVKAAEVTLEALEKPAAPPPAQDWQVKDADRAIQDADAKLQLAEIALNKLKAGPNAHEVAVAKAEVDAAEAELAIQEKKLQEFKGGPIFGGPRETKADLEGAVQRAKEAVKVARAKYDRIMNAGPKDEDIRAAQLQVALAKNEHERVKAAKDRLLNPQAPPPALPSDIAKARIELSKAKAAERAAKAAVDEAKRGPDPAKIDAAAAVVTKRESELAGLTLHMEGMTLRAPTDGIITRRHQEPGATIPPFTPIVTMSDFGRKRVRAEFDIGRMAEIQPKMPVTISGRALGQETLDGKVLEILGISTRKLFSDDPTASRGGDVVTVLIGVDEPKGEERKKVYHLLRLALPVDVEITVEQKDNVVRIPKSFVAQDDGKEYVWLIPPAGPAGKTEAPRRQPVKTGLKDEHWVEIADGLADGDQIMKPQPVNGHGKP
jgi:multidrug efflux pump subunit AcrA (membrane-fusion protein)